MTEYRYSYGEKPNTPACVMALGFFDGVHVGHRALLSRARLAADKLGLPLGVFTFASDGKIKEGAPRIYSDAEKAEILKELRVDFIVFADFDSIRAVTDTEFVQSILVEKLSVRCAVCGYNYRFGKGASGTASYLANLMETLGGECIICDKFTLNGTDVSTTAIRRLLLGGSIAEANMFLGSPYRINNTVKTGNGVGHSLGYPTINTESNSPALLRRGVYASAVRVGDRVYKALTNVGICPTFPERDEHLETYILDFNGDLYGEKVTVFLLDFIRDEKQFSNEKELIMQINIDKNTVLYEIGDSIWEQIGLK